MRVQYKKIISFCLAIIISIVMVVPVLASNDISVYLDGQKIQFDVAPLLINGRTMVPMRAIFEKLGATVNWNNSTQTAFATKGNTNISISINDATLYKNGQAIKLDVPAQLKSGRTLVPLRAISEAFGCDVKWNGTTQTIQITSTSSVIPTPQNIRIIKQEDDTAFIQWDKVDNADYYHFYEFGPGDTSYNIAKDSNGVVRKFKHYDDDFSIAFNNLEIGCEYSVMIAAVKDDIESVPSTPLAFTFTPSNASYGSSPNGGSYSSNTKITLSSFPLYLYSNDGTGTFLGEINSNKYDTDSIANDYGNYGSKYQINSIFNQYGTYGSSYSQYSAFNEYATKPPKILDKNGNVVGYLTANKYITYGISYEGLMVLLRNYNK